MHLSGIDDERRTFRSIVLSGIAERRLSIALSRMAERKAARRDSGSVGSKAQVLPNMLVNISLGSHSLWSQVLVVQLHRDELSSACQTLLQLARIDGYAHPKRHVCLSSALLLKEPSLRGIECREAHLEHLVEVSVRMQEYRSRLEHEASRLWRHAFKHLLLGSLDHNHKVERARSGLHFALLEPPGQFSIEMLQRFKLFGN